MNFPNLYNKHANHPLFSPEHMLNKKKLEEKYNIIFPQNYIIFYLPYLLKHISELLPIKKIDIDPLLSIFIHKNTGFICINGIGAPNAVYTLEKLIALGGKSFINTGTCGGLNCDGVHLCEKSIRDEGTSYHYVEPSQYAFPDKEFTDELFNFLNSKALPFSKTANWTTDAVFMETKEEVIYFSNKGIKTVDMETSAIFSVGKAKKVKTASILCVSDILTKNQWKPLKNYKNIKQQLKLLVNFLIEFLILKQT